jgi:hypothetical protein
MAHYRQQFPTALRHKETETPCPADPEGQKHQWEKRSDLEIRKSPDGYEWEEHPWQCKRCQTIVWVPKGIELK